MCEQKQTIEFGKSLLLHRCFFDVEGKKLSEMPLDQGINRLEEEMKIREIQLKGGIKLIQPNSDENHDF